MLANLVRSAACALPLRSLIALLFPALALAGTVHAGLPQEVVGLSWCPSTRDCLRWSESPGATEYIVDRGDPSGLAALLDGSGGACSLGRFAETSTGPVVTASPAPGTLHWFLVRAAIDDSVGSAGSSTEGPRQLVSQASCASPAGLRINEIDYDQPGADAAEFVEIVNSDPFPRSLEGLVLIFVNGSSSSEYGRVDLSGGGSVAGGGYLVAGSPEVLAALPEDAVGLSLGTTIQNGAPDGVVLFDTVAGMVLDALSYEGVIAAASFDGVIGTYPLVDGAPATASDSSTVDGSLGRFPDGVDTGSDADDWHFLPVPTPGAPNTQ